MGHKHFESWTNPPLSAIAVDHGPLCLDPDPMSASDVRETIEKMKSPTPGKFIRSGEVIKDEYGNIGIAVDVNVRQIASDKDLRKVPTIADILDTIDGEEIKSPELDAIVEQQKRDSEKSVTLGTQCQGCGVVYARSDLHPYNANNQTLSLCTTCIESRVQAKLIPTDFSTPISDRFETTTDVKSAYQQLHSRFPPQKPVRISELEKQIESLRRELNKMNDIAVSWENRCKDVERLRDIVKGDLDELRKKLAAADEAIRSLSQDKQDLITSHDHYAAQVNAEIEGADQRIAGLQCELRDMQGRIDRNNQHSANLLAENQNLRSANRSAEKKISELNAEIEKKNREITHLRKNHDNLIDMTTDYRSAMADELNRVRATARQEGITQGVQAERKNSRRFQMLCYIVGMIVGGGLATLVAILG